MIKITQSPDESTYKVDEIPGAVRIETLGGPAVVYADLIGNGSIVNVKWICNPSEYESLVANYVTDLNNGADWFLIDLILDNPYVEEYTASFVPYSFMLAEQEGLTYVVTAQLEVAQAVADDEFDEIITDIYPGDPLAVTNLLDLLLNVHIAKVDL